MPKVKIYFSNRQKQVKLPEGLRTNIRKCCEEALSAEQIEVDSEVSVTVVDNAEIKKLNREHRDKDKVTDVLSFPMGADGEYDINPDTGRIMLGDIVISASKAEDQAKEYGHSLMRELCFLTTHSMFHLLGYDHEVSVEEEKIMFDKQNMVLEKLGITR
ncbi:MAG: rRNA maturation RNase YbeY [Oscillospiraceae bacterium]|nr:rRNA maturation RNase YbeY [Oscillospiraceae bacterium]